MYINESAKRNHEAAALKAAKEASDKVLEVFMKKYAALRLSDPAAFAKAKELLPDKILAKLEEHIDKIIP